MNAYPFDDSFLGPEEEINFTPFTPSELMSLTNAVNCDSIMADDSGNFSLPHDPHGVLNHGNIPSRDDFPGRFNFTTRIDAEVTGNQWVYSDILQQYFIEMNKTLIMQFCVNADAWEYNRVAGPLFIRALPVYSTDEYVNLPVNRCTFHCVEDDPKGQAHPTEDICQCSPENNFVRHVVRAECGDDATYMFDRRSKRHSVRVAIGPPQAGTDYLPIPYSFACKTSCSRGMMRRPIHVIFTLENRDGAVFGRQKICVKICSCPKRDKTRQEEDQKVAENEPFLLESSEGDKTVRSRANVVTLPRISEEGRSPEPNNNKRVQIATKDEVFLRPTAKVGRKRNHKAETPTNQPAPSLPLPAFQFPQIFKMEEVPSHQSLQTVEDQFVHEINEITKIYATIMNSMQVLKQKLARIKELHNGM